MTRSGLPSTMSPPDATAHPSALPDFGQPPVVEVALSVQFEPLPLQTKHLALLWEKCRAEFPEWQDHAPIPPAFESFGSGLFNARFRTTPLVRALFRNRAGTELKQYQDDRFVRNWTKAADAPTYPRPLGRLHVVGRVVTVLETGGKALQLTLTARGQPLGTGVDGVITFLNLGREHIVRGFASFTTAEMHKTWGRRDGRN